MNHRLPERFNRQGGLALIPVLLVIAVLTIGSGLTIGTYVAGQRSARLESLQSEVASLKDQLKATPQISPSPSATPEASPTPSVIPTPVVPAVKGTVTTSAPKTQPAPKPEQSKAVIPSPSPSPIPTVDKRQECEQHALSAKSKFVINLEGIKSKYQPEHDKNYYSLIAQGRYEEAKALQAQWELQITNINNLMANAYDIALANCLGN